MQQMKRYLLFLVFVSLMVTVGCNRKSGCPSYNHKTGEYGIKGKKKKTDAGLFPKSMRKAP